MITMNSSQKQSSDLTSKTQTKLEDLAKDSHIIQTGVAPRLRALSVALGGSDPTTSSIWREVDIYKAVNIEAVVESVKVHMVPHRFLRLLEWTRNVLILAPLVFTWLGIWQATNKYSQLLANDPGGTLASKPFLYLWQQGFNQTLWDGFTLSSLAVVDCSILTFTLILTAVVTWRHSIINAEKEKQASELKVAIADALSDAILCLNDGQQQWQQQPKDMEAAVKLLFDIAKEFKRANGEFLHELAAERQQRGSLADFSTALTNAAKEMVAASGTMQKSNEDLALAIRSVVGPIAEIPRLVQATERVVVDLHNMTGELQRLVTEHARLQQALQTDLATRFDALLLEQKNASKEQITLLSKRFDEQKRFESTLHSMIDTSSQNLIQEQQKLGDKLINAQKLAAQELQNMLKAMLDQRFKDQQHFESTLHSMIDTSFQNLINEQQRLGDRLIDEADTLEEATRSFVTVLTTLKTFTEKQQDVIKGLETQQNVQTTMTERMGEITAATSQILSSTRAAIPELWDMSISLNNIVGALNAIPKALENELLQPLKAYSSAAAKIDTGSQTLEDAATKLHVAASRLGG